MRRILYLLPALGILLTGCSALPYAHQIDALPYAHQIDRTALMEVLGVDAAEEGLVTVTAASGPRPEDQEPLVLSAQAETLSAACADMGRSGEDYVFFGDVEQVLVGEEEATSGLEPLLTHMARDPELRLEAELWVVKGAPASSLLLEPVEGESLPDRLSALSRNAQLLGGPRPQMARGALTDLLENGDTLLPALERREDGAGNDLLENGDTLLPALERREDGAGNSVLAGAGYAVVRDGALRGYLGEEAAFGADLLRGLGEGQVLELPGPGLGSSALKLTGIETSFRTAFQGERLTGLRVACTLETQAAERTDGVPGLGEEDRRTLEAELARQATAAIAAAMAGFRALDADAIHLLDRVALAVPWKTARLEAQWEEVFPRLEVSIQVEATVARD